MRNSGVAWHGGRGEGGHPHRIIEISPLEDSSFLLKYSPKCCSLLPGTVQCPLQKFRIQQCPRVSPKGTAEHKVKKNGEIRQTHYLTMSTVCHIDLLEIEEIEMKLI